MHLSTTLILIHTHMYMYIHSSSTIVPLLPRSKFSFFAWREDGNEIACNSWQLASSYGRLMPRYRKRRWIFLYSREARSAHENKRVHGSFRWVHFWKILSFNARRYPVINVASKYVGGDEVNGAFGRRVGEFFCTRWKFVATFKRGFWTIEIEKLRFLGGDRGSRRDF